MNELNELYQQVILDHNKNPRNFGVLQQHNHSAEGHNPLCGDQIEIYIDLEDGIVKDISFECSGCAISKASASIMTTLLKGKKIEEVKKLFDEFHQLVTCDKDEQFDLESLGKLAVFSGVREFPTRIKCASLAWHTLLAALEKNNQSVSTE